MAEVKDEMGREAVDRVLEGVTNTQRQVGIMPGGAEADAFARNVVARQVTMHEEREASAMESAPVAPPPSAARLDRGEIPDDAEVIGNTLGGPVNQMTPQAQRHMFGARLPLIDQLMLARLKLLKQFPEWDARVHAAWLSGEHDAMMSGSEPERTDAYRRHMRQAESVIKVLDESSAVFGDWRTPQKNGRTKLIMVPLG